MERHVFAHCRSKRHFSDSDRLSSHHGDQSTRPSNIEALELTLANLNHRISSLSLTSRPALESCGSEYSSGFDDMSLKSGSSVDSCFSSVGSLDSQSREKTCHKGLDVNHNGPATPTLPDFSGRPEFLQRSFSSPSKFPNVEQNGNTAVSSFEADGQVTSLDVKVTVSAQLKDTFVEAKPGWRTWLRGQTRLSLRDSSTRNKTKLAIFDEAGGSHVVLVCETTTARDLIQMLVTRTQSDESVHWTILEDIHLGRAERIVEDHELILTVKKNWSSPRESKFVFKKDPRKNDPFIHPERLFSEHMKDRNSDRKRLNSEAERAREILMMDLVVESDRTPDLQGDLYLKAGGTGKWQKAYSFLRGSGLHYSTKGKTQDPKRLRCFSRLDDVDVYVVKRANRRDKVPTSHCLMLKPKTMELGERMKEFGCICTKSEEALLCWLAGLRTVKYGAILRQNFIRRRGIDDVAFLADVST